MLIMLIGSSLTVLFLFHGLGLWATLYGPRRGNYNSSMGNDLSFLGNMVVIGGVLVALALPRVLSRFAPAVVRPENWWDAVPAVLAALVFYIASLRLAGELFVTRRERLLAVLEGRD
jgi:cytochrome b561